MSRGPASPIPVSAGPTVIARGPRWDPPHNIAGRSFGTFGTRQSPDGPAPSVTVVLHGSRPLPTHEQLPPRTNPRIATGNCEPHIATVNRVGASTEHMRSPLFVRHGANGWLLTRAIRIPDKWSRRILKGYGVHPSGSTPLMLSNRLPRYMEGHALLPPDRCHEQVARETIWHMPGAGGVRQVIDAGRRCRATASTTDLRNSSAFEVR